MQSATVSAGLRSASPPACSPRLPQTRLPSPWSGRPDVTWPRSLNTRSWPAASSGRPPLP